MRSCGSGFGPMGLVSMLGETSETLISFHLPWEATARRHPSAN